MAEETEANQPSSFGFISDTWKGLSTFACLAISIFVIVILYNKGLQKKNRLANRGCGGNGGGGGGGGMPSPFAHKNHSTLKFITTFIFTTITLNTL